MRPDEIVRRYRELMGDEKADRQELLARKHYPCCGMPKEKGHHPLCDKVLKKR